VVTTLQKYIGNGLYTVKEAALYARVREPLMRRWLFGTKDRRAVLDLQFGTGEKLVSFLDLIQTLAIREIRLQYNVPLQKFRQAIRWVKKARNLEYPFARRHFTYLLGKELVIALRRDEYVQASGTHAGQRLLPFVEMYLENLTFNREGLANSYQIFKSDDEVPIVMNPDRRFGEPLLPSGYSAVCIWDAIKAEGGIDNATKAYGIPREEVTAAYKFIDHLGPAAA